MKRIIEGEILQFQWLNTLWLAGVLLLVGVLLLLPAFTLAAELSIPAQDNWYRLSLGTTYLGYLHSTVKHIREEGAPRIESRMEMSLKIKRMNVTIPLLMRSVYIDNENFEPQSFSSEIKLSAMSTIIRGRVHGSNIEIEQIQGGQRSKKLITLGKNVIFPSMKFVRILGSLLKPGVTKEITIFIPDILSEVKHHITNLGEEQIYVNGVAVKAFKLKTMNDLQPGTPTYEWIDSRGNTYLFETSMLGMTLQGMLCPKQQAISGKTNNLSVDIFTKSLIKPAPGFSFSPAALREATFTLTFDSQHLSLELPRSKQQQTLQQSEKKLIVKRIKTALPKKAEPISDEKQRELASFLASSAYIQNDDPKIIQMAHKLANSERNPAQLAQIITHAVYSMLKKKNLSVGFASASEVLKNKEGDCSEHAVLAAALLRALNIPTRLCVGLVYSPSVKVFGYHMWVDAYIGDKWWELDPTFDQVNPDVSHIAFAKGSMEGRDLFTMSSQLNQFMAHTKIAVTEEKR